MTFGRFEVKIISIKQITCRKKHVTKNFDFYIYKSFIKNVQKRVENSIGAFVLLASPDSNRTLVEVYLEKKEHFSVSFSSSTKLFIINSLLFPDHLITLLPNHRMFVWSFDSEKNFPRRQRLIRLCVTKIKGQYCSIYH